MWLRDKDDNIQNPCPWGHFCPMSKFVLFYSLISTVLAECDLRQNLSGLYYISLCVDMIFPYLCVFECNGEGLNRQKSKLGISVYRSRVM